MAKKAKRSMAARIVLTAQAYKAVADAAFQNCRTVSQELSYMIERQIGQKCAKSDPVLFVAGANDRYDTPAATQEVRHATEAATATLPPAGWTQEQEDAIYALGKDAGLTESNITALRLIHKHFDAVKAAIESERVPA